MIATVASIVGSQAVISATFSIVNQCMARGCFPRVKVVHTSNNIYTHIYIPEINWFMLLLCLALTIGFQDVIEFGNAYGMYSTTFFSLLPFKLVDFFPYGSSCFNLTKALQIWSMSAVPEFPSSSPPICQQLTLMKFVPEKYSCHVVHHSCIT